MTFGLGFDNAIVACQSALAAYADDVERQHTAPGATDNVPDAIESSVPMLDKSFADRFAGTPEQVKRQQVQQVIERRIPGDRVSAAMPIPCEVDWTTRQVRTGPNKYQERTGKGKARYEEFVLKWILAQGSRVQFRRQLPGKETTWYEVVALMPRPSVLGGVPGIIEFELREAVTPKTE